MKKSKLHRALLWAAKLHAGLDRDGETPLPYLTHAIEVLENLRYVGGVTDEVDLCAAVLHDVVEWGGAKPREVREKFGKKVARLVEELTRREPSEEETKDLSPDQISELRFEILLNEVKQMSQQAQRIKLADRLSNLREAVRTENAKDLKKYLARTKKLLAVIPREVSEELWDANDAILKANQ